MLYISLILIASGILFILYTLISSTRRQLVRRDSLPDTNADIPATIDVPGSAVISADSDNYVTEKAVNIHTDKGEENKIEKYPEDERKDFTVEEKKDIEPVETEAEYKNKLSEEQNSRNISGKDISMKDLSIIPDVSLYEDSSDIIDYEKNDSMIDSGLDKYKKIKRIGEGTIELLNDGINFRTGKKLFRFDYHRVNDVKKGKNYFVLLMKGSSTNRIFVFKNDTVLNNKLNQFSHTNAGNVR